MAIDMREQKFGLELEFTGIARSQAAAVLAKHFGVTAQHFGGSYDKYIVSDAEGREWTIARDSSLSPEKKDGSFAGDECWNFAATIARFMPELLRLTYSSRWRYRHRQLTRNSRAVSRSRYRGGMGRTL